MKGERWNRVQVWEVYTGAGVGGERWNGGAGGGGVHRMVPS